MKILVINPVGTDRWNEGDKRLFISYASPETAVDVVSLDRGPESVESRRTYVEVTPLVVEKALSAYRGYDGVIVNCFLDPAVDVLKSLLDVPVVGPCEASLALASLLGWSFGIVTAGGETDMLWERVRLLGYEGRVKSIRSIGIHVVELDRDVERTKRELIKECEKALDEGAEVIVLGCTGLAGLNKPIEEKLNVNVIDPAAAALKQLEALVKLGLRKRRPKQLKVS